jgi:hypothetical protein
MRDEREKRGDGNMKKKKKKKKRRRQSAEELLGPACCAQATVQAASSRVADGRTGGRADKQARNATPRLVSNGARQWDRTAVLPPPRAPPLPMPPVTGYGIAG